MCDTEFFSALTLTLYARRKRSNIFFSIKPNTVTKLTSQIFWTSGSCWRSYTVEMVLNTFSGDHCFVSGLYSCLFVCLFCYLLPWAPKLDLLYNQTWASVEKEIKQHSSPYDSLRMVIIWHLLILQRVSSWDLCITDSLLCNPLALSALRVINVK